MQRKEQLALQEGKKLTPEKANRLAQLKLKVEKRRQQDRERRATKYQARRAEADQLAELQSKKQLAQEGGRDLAPEEAKKLAWLKPRVAQWKQNKRNENARQSQARKAEADQLAELQSKKQLAQEEGRDLAPEEAEKLAWLKPRVEEQKQKKRNESARQYQARRAEADQLAELQSKKQLAREKGKELTREEAEKLEWLESRLEPRKQKHRSADRNYKRARKDAAADEFAKFKELEVLEERRQLNPEQRAELNLRRKIEKDEKEAKRLAKRVSRLKEKDAEIEALEALSQSAEVEDQLHALREKVAESASSAEELKETRERLKKNRAALKSLQARKETGPGEIAGVGVSGQQNEQDAMASSEGSESAGADQDEQDTWSDGGVDLGVWVDEVMADSGGEGQAAASLSGLDEDRQAGLEASWESDAAMQAESERERESGEGLGEVVEEGVEGVARDEGQDSRVAQLWESLEQAESYLASFGDLPGWDEVVQADPALLPMFDQGLRADWEETQRRVEALRAELAGLVVGGEGEPAGEQVGESGEGRAAGFVPAAIAGLAELTGRMDRHLRAMPP
ncbi:hypothetical protein ACWDKQ_35905, partial [Saccharopolyspora sp. NPDC000995]